MENIILFSLATLMTVGIILFLGYRAIKKANNLIDKIVEIIIAIVIVTIILIYLLDRFDIPTTFGGDMNVNTQNWLSFIGTYVTGIVSAIISALVAFWITKYQIRKNNEENEQRDRKNAKIQNMPILKYNMDTNRDGIDNFDKMIWTKEKDGILYVLNIYLKNVGMNTIRNLKVDLEFNNNEYGLIGGKSQQPLEKSEDKRIIIWLNLPCEDNEYKMKLKILYQDILTNWYTQEVEINYKTTNIFKKGVYQSSVDYIVKEEKELENN